MKKSILFALSVLTAASLTACQNQAKTAAETQESIAETVQESAETAENEETDANETDAEETEEAVNFDNSWAGNDYEKQLPELPFEHWRIGTAHDENAYLIIAEDVLYTNVKEYGEHLMESAFTEDIWLNDESEGLGYRITAENKRGYSIDYDFGAYSDEEPITGMLTIEIKKLD